MARETIATRPATAEDAANIVRMHRALSEERDYPSYFAVPEKRIVDTITDETAHGIYIVAEHTYLDGSQDEVDEFHETVGYVRASRAPMQLTGNSGLIIDDLYVRPELGREYGTGINLLAHAAHMAIEFADGNPDSTFLRVDTANGNNDPTLRQYQGTGFEGNNTNLRLHGEAIKELANRVVTSSMSVNPYRL